MNAAMISISHISPVSILRGRNVIKKFQFCRAKIDWPFALSLIATTTIAAIKTTATVAYPKTTSAMLIAETRHHPLVRRFDGSLTVATFGDQIILSFLPRPFQNPVRGSSPHSSPKLHGMARLGNWTDKKKRMGAATVVASQQARGAES